VPLHTSPVGRTFGYRDGDLPVTEDLSGRLLRLPLFYGITEGEQARVVEAVRSFLERGTRPARAAVPRRSPLPRPPSEGGRGRKAESGCPR
jgi:dTDP-4-amino-4,6-dideoxygalactose transaminase